MEDGCPLLLPCEGHLADACWRPDCQLEAVCQGGYLGLRSRAAGGRLLQMRRTGRHRLAFYSPLFGYCEQWEVRP